MDKQCLNSNKCICVSLKSDSRPIVIIVSHRTSKVDLRVTTSLRVKVNIAVPLLLQTKMLLSMMYIFSLLVAQVVVVKTSEGGAKSSNYSSLFTSTLLLLTWMSNHPSCFVSMLHSMIMML